MLSLLVVFSSQNEMHLFFFSWQKSVINGFLVSLHNLQKWQKNTKEKVLLMFFLHPSLIRINICEKDSVFFTNRREIERQREREINRRTGSEKERVSEKEDERDKQRREMIKKENKRRRERQRERDRQIETERDTQRD